MITATIHTKVGEIKRVATQLNRVDKWGAIKLRWRIGRNNYQVEPGLYATGNPDENSDVFVTANYKLSFDHLRKNLDGINAWILVLDTKGINVWCAAGKGTFGTTELVNRIRITRLKEIIKHRRIIVPQLGATGVSAYKVKALTAPNSDVKIQFSDQSTVQFQSVKNNLTVDRGFNVVFGPVRAADIKAFIANGYKTTEVMRKVTFSFYDRMKLIPVDFVYGGTKLLTALILIFILSGINARGISLHQAFQKGPVSAFYLFVAYITGIIVTPLLLPYIPGKMFAFKGLITGLFSAFILAFSFNKGNITFETLAWFMLIPAISSFMAMNFTGSSTFTSLSGVKKEMRVFVPIQIIFAVTGLVMIVWNNLKT
jgi:hypothetical protein